MTAPAPVGSSIVVSSTGSSNNNTGTVDALSEIYVIDVIAYYSSGGIQRPTVSLTGETVLFSVERFAQFSVANDQYAGRFWVDSPGSGSKTLTITFPTATAMTCFGHGWQNIGDTAAPFVDGDGDESVTANNNPTLTTNATADDTILSSAGYYDRTISSINDGGTNLQLDQNGVNYISRSSHYIAGSAPSVTSSITLSNTAQWIILNSTIGGNGGGGGSGRAIPIVGRGPGMSLAGRGGLAGKAMVPNENVLRFRRNKFISIPRLRAA